MLGLSLELLEGVILQVGYRISLLLCVLFLVLSHLIRPFFWYTLIENRLISLPVWPSPRRPMLSLGLRQIAFGLMMCRMMLQKVGNR